MPVAKLVRRPFHRIQTRAQSFEADAGYAKFAKHFKLEEQASFLNKTRTGIAVGTPQRLIDLIENGTYTLQLPD
jgi:superfamily II DNA/RNA helicase